MGYYASGTLFWGYCWNEERSAPWTTSDEGESDVDLDDDSGWEARYARTRGCVPPSTQYPQRSGFFPKDYSPDEQAIVAQYREYFTKKYEVASTSGCVVGSHGYEGSIPFVAITTSVVRTSEGDSTEVTNLTVGADWEVKLEEFCRVMKITPPGKAAWWLVSYYG